MPIASLMAVPPAPTLPDDAASSRTPAATHAPNASAPPPASAAAAVALAGAMTATGVHEPPAAGQGPDAAGLRQYRLALASEARRFRRYPEIARREGTGGTAEVMVVVAAAGVRRVELVRSSGHALLDAAAQEMMSRAAERAELPASLRGQDFAVRVPVVFSLED
ncbi:MAG: energy transducer TonB [Rhodocyclaceae bacterium]|nr:energy transducer TonB [Rhodocyclaceae bacterium]